MKHKSSLLLSIINWVLLFIFVSIGIAGAMILGFNLEQLKEIGLGLIVAGFASATIQFVVVTFYFKSRALDITKELFENDFESKMLANEFIKAGYIAYNESGKIIYISEYLISKKFGKFLGKDISVLPMQSTTLKNEESQGVVANAIYSFRINTRRRIINVMDVSDNRNLEEKMKEKQHVVIVIKMDYSYNTKLDNTKYSLISSKITGILHTVATKLNGTLSISPAGDETIIISELRHVENFFKDERKFFDEFKKVLNNDRKEVIISVGISSEDKTISQLTNDAREFLREAISKGGNMIVAKFFDEKKYMGVSISEPHSGTQIEISFFKDVLDMKIQSARNVLITCHSYADADAVASVLAMTEYVKKSKKHVKYLINTFDDTGKNAYEKLVGRNLKSDRANKQLFDREIRRNTLLIILDTTDANRLQISKAKLEKIPKTKTIIIDHHRVSHEAIKTDVDSILLNTNTSSASELVTQLIWKKIDSSIEKLRSWESIQLLALGIYVDTNGLTKNSGPGTFDAISWLSKAGADTNDLNKYLNISKNIIPEMVELYSNVFILKGRFIFSYFNEEKKIPNDVISQFANQLLNFDGIDASFVIARTTNNSTKISARSRNDFNVQKIMRELGGGGHFDTAAASFSSNASIPKILEKLKDQIRKESKRKK